MPSLRVLARPVLGLRSPLLRRSYSASTDLLQTHTTPAPHFGTILTLTLNSPANRNALSLSLLHSLLTTITSLPPQTRGLILTHNPETSPRVFCAGADLRERLAFTTADTLSFLGTLNKTLNHLAALPIPTVAAFTGAALGGGLEMALACDLRVVGKSAIMGLPETRIGVIPGAGGTWRLPKVVGRGRAMEMVLTGRRVGSEEAGAWGLVNRVVEDGEVRSVARALVEECCDGAPVALGAVKRVLGRGEEGEMEGYREVLGTKDRVEALRCFVNKEKVVWKGE